MKAGIALAILLVAAVLILAVQGGAGGFPLPQILPGLGGPKPALYECAGICMLAIAGWGIARVMRRNR